MNNLQLIIQKLISIVFALFLAVTVINSSTLAEESTSEQIDYQLVNEIKTKLIKPVKSEAVSEAEFNTLTDQTQVELESLNQVISSDEILNSGIEIGEIARMRRELIKLDLEHQKVVLESKIAEVINADAVSIDSKELLLEIAKLVEELEVQKGKQTDSLNDFRTLDPLPVVVEIVGSAGHLEARLLVPYFGEVIARIGMTLPNGMKVTSITAAKVIATMNGVKQTLPFGTSVPASRKHDQTDKQNIAIQKSVN